MKRLGVVLFVFVVAATATANAACPDKRASCVLHEEGVALFLEGKHEQAAAKFAAAIAAEPTARSYLGYAQAVEALGQIALAYDTMVNAQRLSQAELQSSGGKDPEITGRAERIKYKLGELRAKIGFVWLRVPDGVPPQRVISVQREGEGDLSQPLTQWTAVAPGRQVLVASIDDGTKLQVIAQVAAGSQGVVVIPIQARARPPVGGGPRPPIGVVAPFPLPKPQPPVHSYFTVGLSLATPGPKDERVLGPDETGSIGTGITALYERRVGSSLGWTSRFEYLHHGETESFSTNDSTSGFELVVLGGVRTFGSKTAHGRVGAGFSLYTHNSTVGFVDETFTRIYPAFEIGGGVHLGRLRVQMGVMLTAAGDAQVELGTRFMGTIGIDLFRK